MLDPRSELNNPSTPPERLAELAQQHPELGTQIAAHPNSYPELRDWIAQYASPAAAPAQPGPQQPEGFQPPQGQDQQPQQFTQPTQSLPTGPLPTGPQPDFFSQPTVSQPTASQPTASQPTQALPTESYNPQQAGPWPGQQPQGYDPAAPAGYAQQPGAPAKPKSKKSALFVTLGIVLLVLLAAGGGLWWFLGSKIGGSATPEAAAKKLITSVSSLDPLSLYGSLAPSEFSAFEPASKQLLETQTDKDAKTAEQFLSDLKREVKIETTTPLETTTDEIVEGEVERVTITEGVIEIDGDPEKVAQAIMDFYGPIAEAQSESYGYPLSKSDLADLRDEIEDDLKDQLPYEIDFSDLDFDFTLVSVKEGGSWYVSPIMTFADYAHQSSGVSDKVLGDEIVAPAKNGAKSPEDAAKNLTEAVFAGDYDAIVEQMPLPERRLLSIYGESFAEQAYMDTDDFGSAMDEYGLELEEAKFKAKNDDGASRLTIDRLAFSTEYYDYWSDLDLTQNIEIAGTCVTVEGERVEYVDYYSDEYDHLWDQWWNDLSYPGSYSDWLRDHGYEEYEVSTQSEEFCLTEEVPMLDDLGVDEWAIVAVQEGGDWKISPLGTVADISAIVANKINEAAEKGKLDKLFT